MAEGKAHALGVGVTTMTTDEMFALGIITLLIDCIRSVMGLGW